MPKKHIIRLIAIVLAVMMPLLTAQICFAEEDTQTSATEQTQSYLSPDINGLTGHGAEPEELSVSSAAKYQEKAWYEYVMYSEHAVSSYRVNDDTRILFYDPYTYTNSMVMEVDFDANTTGFDTMSSYSISHTNSKTIEACVSSTNTYNMAEQTSGRDVYHTDVKNGGETHTKYNYDENHRTTGSVTENTNYEYIPKATLQETYTLASSQEISLNAAITVNESSATTVGMQWVTDDVSKTTTYSDDYKTTINHNYEYDVEDKTTSATDGWQELSARVTKTIGSSSSTSNSWSETELTTITKTYAATHFAADGITPLPWAIVHYRVLMPMKCCLQVKYEGEWVTTQTIYCLLTTVQGTCRSWMQNGQAYYEDWGSGEPVVETEFWSQFMTREQLMSAYADKLYPEGES